MSLAFDQKEDLRLRMVDLEKKLAKSEEERSKLEKTCNVLMRAFREEEKMQYKALNKKYEKFLEDCSVRKRRNDIILRSLCRIEDRSRALFAKTERLKLLKDRYISYLKISDVKKEEINFQSCGKFPLSPASEKITKDVASKLVQWKTPLATHWETGGELFLGGKSPRTTSSDSLARVIEGNFEKFERQKSEDKLIHEGKRTSEINVLDGIPNVEEPGRSSNAPDEPIPVKSRFDLNDQWTNSVPKQISKQISPEHRVEELREKQVIGRYGSNGKVKKTLSVEEEIIWGKNDEGHVPYNREVVENAERVERSPNTTQTKCRTSNLVTSTPNVTNYKNEESRSENEEFDTKADSHADNQEENLYSSENDSKALPMGLDGVDYQNETYPESYYEQPVHHNHASIASDVILEEDETEQELDEEANDFTPDHGHREAEPNAFGTGNGHESTPWARSSGHGALDEPRWESEANKETDESDKGRVGNGQALDEVKSQGSHSEQSVEAKRSDKSEKSERVVTDRSDRNKTIAKSNLFHLLESDSESFQIEHGDVNSGNEDSDFDFSFHQN